MGSVLVFVFFETLGADASRWIDIGQLVRPIDKLTNLRQVFRMIASRPRAAFPALKLVRPKRMYEQIAEQIEALIRSGSFAPGSRLPAERELAETIGVSRPSIREALIALETAGLIETRVGDGTYVGSTAAIASGLPWTRNRDFGPGPLEQFVARQAIEPACAELAARTATPVQLDRLQASYDRMERTIARGENPAAEHARFHVLIAEAANNTVLENVARELWRLRAGEMWETLRRRVEAPDVLALGLSFRRHLLSCLRARDAAGARAAMQSHLDRVGALYFGPEDPAPATRPATPAKTRRKR
jgi:DNA-binding FadR family transcriptional regulator